MGALALVALVAAGPAFGWTRVSPDEVSMWAGGGKAHFTVPLGEPGVRRLELHFARPLDGARVDVEASGPRHLVTVVRGLRCRGEVVTVELPELTLDRVEVVVHHHLRPVPFPPSVWLGRPGTPGSWCPDREDLPGPGATRAHVRRHGSGPERSAIHG